MGSVIAINSEVRNSIRRHDRNEGQTSHNIDLEKLHEPLDGHNDDFEGSRNWSVLVIILAFIGVFLFGALKLFW